VYSNPAATAFADTPLLTDSPYLRQVLATFLCPLEAVRLMRLRPGSAIRPHGDHDLAPELGHARLHIPVVTNPDVDFRLNGTRVVMKEGECWYLRLSDTHSVVNRGETDRVHLVIDAVVDPWLESVLREADRTSVAEGESEPPSDLQRFRSLVSADAALQQELLGVEDVRAFITLAVRIAARHGCRITADDVEHAMDETRQSWRERIA
jgi:hypothetical protein